MTFFGNFGYDAVMNDLDDFESFLEYWESRNRTHNIGDITLYSERNDLITKEQDLWVCDGNW